MGGKKLTFAFISGLLLLIYSITSVFAEVALPNGAVKGLPEKLTAMDSSGKSVNSATGEYFFLAEDMTFGEVYTKDIQLMNLRDDEAYHIYFYIEPVQESKKGEIDLEQGCVCSFYLDGKQFYSGTVSGVGNVDLTREVKDLGYYEPGDSHKLTCSVAWVNDPGDYYIDEGHRIVSCEGTQIERDRSGQSHISGELEFKWIFAATVDENYEPPNTGLLASNGTVWLVLIWVIAALILIMILLLVKKKKEKKKV